MKEILVPWYSREDWPRVLEVMADAPSFPVSYDEWRSISDHAIAEVYVRGGTAREIRIRPDDFFSWCAENGEQTDSDGRVKFIRHVIKESPA